MLFVKGKVVAVTERDVVNKKTGEVVFKEKSVYVVNGGPPFQVKGSADRLHWKEGDEVEIPVGFRSWQDRSGGLHTDFMAVQTKDAPGKGKGARA